MTGRPRIFAVAGWRYEPAWLVDELRDNLSWVDELVIVDDRARTDELWVHEGEYRLMQRRALEAAGIRPWDLVLVTSPDERWGRRAGRILRGLAAAYPRRKRIYEFPLRELWTPTRYRIDGFWGNKWRPRVFPYLSRQVFTSRAIQTVPVPVDRGYHRVRVPKVPIYHLENVAPASRAERAIVYEALSPGSQHRAARSPYWKRHDPTGRYMRAYGYAYLADSRGLRCAPVPAGDITPPPVRPYVFRVPDDLLEAASVENGAPARTRAEWERWLRSTLAGPPATRPAASPTMRVRTRRRPLPTGQPVYGGLSRAGPR